MKAKTSKYKGTILEEPEKPDMPYQLLASDPKYRKPRITNRSNPIKSLTIKKSAPILKYVRKLRRKGNKMATNKIKINQKKAGISIAWLAEATFRGFVGWLLLTHFDNYVTVVAALYALGTAGVIVIAHFIGAHNNI